jgi:hypothetical protein
MNDICGDVRDVLVQAVISMTDTHAADEPN